ncbi:MAG: carbohydrate-binding domain-containing protein [Paludibacteraceae bacterium]|nr:carbohydrate-binding domain-containing protein [Paludibacteraceae bacterium]
MKKIGYIFLLALVALIGTGCEQTGSSTSGSSTSATTNTGDDASDFVENETWSSTINIIWNGTDVTITGSADGVTVTNDKGYVTVTSTVKNIEYAVSGEGTGPLNIYSDYKFKLSLNGLTLACADGPAINNQCSKTCYVVLGSTNTLTDGSTYASADEDRKAAFFSEGQLCFSGSGTLNITGNYKHALASDDYIRLCEGTGTINLIAKASDGIHTNDGVIINDGVLIINAVGEGIQCDTSSVVITGGETTITSTGDKGILAYGNIEISGGTTYVQSYSKCLKTTSNLIVSAGSVTAICSGSSSNSNTPEGIEAKGTITISGGYVYAQASDDAINSGGDLTVSGGYVMAYSTGNDGLDANGNMYIQGGTVYAISASSPEVALDANTEKGYKLYVQGGTIIAIGGLESGASLSQTCYSATASKNTWYALSGGSEDFVFKTPNSLSTTTMVLTTSGTTALQSGVTVSGGTAILNNYAYAGASAAGGSAVTLSAYSGNNGNQPGGTQPGGGNPGGGNPGGGPGGRGGGW